MLFSNVTSSVIRRSAILTNFPTDFLYIEPWQGPNVTHRRFRDILVSAYNAQSAETDSFLTSPLDELGTLHLFGRFAHHQLWLQLDLRNKAMIKCIRKREAKAVQEESAKAKRRCTFALDLEYDDSNGKFEDICDG